MNKITGLSNTEDAMWYRLSPCDLTLKTLDEIFDLYDNMYEEKAKNIYSYAVHTESNNLSFHKDTKEFIAYFLLTKKELHLILRKTLNWKKYNKMITEKFEWSKAKEWKKHNIRN